VEERELLKVLQGEEMTEWLVTLRRYWLQWFSADHIPKQKPFWHTEVVCLKTKTVEFFKFQYWKGKQRGFALLAVLRINLIVLSI
jgi:hypothetical protein